MSPQVFVGLTEKSAISIADMVRFAYRVVRKDDSCFVMTADFCPDRINFEIDGDIVTAAFFG